jgi:hypothetical protein
MQQTTDVVLSNQAFWLLTTGALVPIVVYMFNHFAEGTLESLVSAIFSAFKKPLSAAGTKVFAEAAKGIIQVAAAAGWGVIYTAVINGAHGTHIFKGAGGAIIAALFAHNTLWKPSNVNIVLGAQPSPTTTGTSEAAPSGGGAGPAVLGIPCLKRQDLFA